MFKLDLPTDAIANPATKPYHVYVSTEYPSPIGRSAVRWTPLVLLLVLGSSCGGGPSRNPFDGTTAPGVDDRIRVEVQNLNFNDATIFAMRSSQRIRVGRVTGKTDQVFTIPWNVAQPIGFEVDVVGGRSCRTGQVLVEAEGRVWVSIPSDMGFGVCRAGRR